MMHFTHDPMSNSRPSKPYPKKADRGEQSAKNYQSRGWEME
jgi:hypothetical protein